jgi:hypothetical protein
MNTRGNEIRWETLPVRLVVIALTVLLAGAGCGEPQRVKRDQNTAETQDLKGETKDLEAEQSREKPEPKNLKGPTEALNDLLASARSLEDFEVLTRAYRGTWAEDSVHFGRREWYCETHPELPSQVAGLILSGRIGLGMTDEQVRASWGQPRDKNRTVSVYGVREQWIYGSAKSYASSRYLYFNDGILTSWQD